MSSVIGAPYSQIALTVAALKALPPGLRAPNYCLFIPALGSWVYYSATSTAADNNTTIFQPTDGVGRWIVTNQSAAPSGGSGITRQPNIATAAATLTDLQRAVNQILSTLTAAGITEALNLTRNYDAANPTNDLINLLGTNNNAVAFTNPHPAKITNSASSVGGGTVAQLTDRTSSDFFTNNISNSWVQIDLGNTRTVNLNGVGLKSRSAATTNVPVNLTIEGSNDGTNFTLIHSWANIGFTAISQDRFVPFTLSSACRYIRIRQPGTDSSGINHLTIGEVYLFGSVSAL